MFEECGFLKCVYGGVVKFFDIRFEFDMFEKLFKNFYDKLKIVEKVVLFLEEGDCIYFDVGMMILYMIDFMDKSKDIVVVINGVMYIEVLIRKEIFFYLFGGYVKYRMGVVIGGVLLIVMDQYRFDKSFLGINGVYIEVGFIMLDFDEVFLKQKVVKQVKYVYVLVDFLKFGEILFLVFVGIGDVIIIMIDVEEFIFDNY